MTLVTNQLINESGAPVDNIYVEVRLLAPTDADNAFNENEAQVVSRVITRSNLNGEWALDLIPNSFITPANTVYQVIQKIPGLTDLVAYISVPAEGATPVSYTLEDLLTVPPEDIPSNFTVNTYGWYSTAELVDDIVEVTFITPFGIDDNTGLPYFDPGNVTPGEEAVLLEDLSLMQPGRD